MTFDNRRGVTVLFGGRRADETGSTSLRDLWEWNGADWTFRTNAGPVARTGQFLAYDSARDVTVFVSAYESQSRPPELWEWNGVEWRLKGSGPLSYFQGLIGTFDQRRRVIVARTGGGETQEYYSCHAIDTDDDGVFDVDDECPDSQAADLIVIGDCESELPNQVFPDGCTMMDRIAECEADARNHGAFVSCVGDLVDQWSDEEAIDPTDKGDIIRCAAQAEPPPHDDTKAGRTPTRRVPLQRSEPSRIEPDGSKVDGLMIEPVEPLRPR